MARNANRPAGKTVGALLSLDFFFLTLAGRRPMSGRDAGRLFHDGKAHAGLVAVLFGYHAPGILGLLAGLERTLHLGRAFHELVEVHRTELAANHPEIAAFGHRRLLLFSCYSAA